MTTSNPIPTKSENQPENGDEIHLSWWETATKPEAQRRFTMIVFFIYLAIFLLSFFLFLFLRDLIGIEVNGKILIGTILVLYSIISIKKVDGDEQATLLIYGEPTINIRSGPVFVPAFICSIETFTTNRIQSEIPRDEDIKDKYTGTDDEGKPVFVVRITTSGHEIANIHREKPPAELSEKEIKKWEKNESHRIATWKESIEKDPLHQRLTLEPTFVTRFTVSDARRFVKTIGNIVEAKRQIADTVVATAQVEFAKRTPVLLLAEIDIISKAIQRAVETLVGEKPDPNTGKKKDPWGIELHDAYILNLGITKTVNIAVADRAAAGFKKDEKRLEGEGLGASEKARLTGIGEGLEAIAKASSTPAGLEALRMETLRQSINKNDKMILAGPDIFTAVSGAIYAAQRTLLPTTDSNSQPPKKIQTTDNSGTGPTKQAKKKGKGREANDKEDGEDHKE